MPLAVASGSRGFGEKDPEALAGLTPGRPWTPAAPSARSEQRPHERPVGEGLTVRIVADYICPWCYIGMARAERLARELPVVLEPWPYELMPHLPPGGLSRELALGRRYPRQYYERLGEQAREEGLPFRLPERLYNTHLAHQAALFAEAAGRGWEMHRALYCAYWGEGEDIGDRDVLCRLAEGCGLDAAALDEALAEGRYREEVDRRQAWARGQGIAGVPTFIFGDGLFALVGAQDYAVFVDVARRLLARYGQG